MGTPAHEKSQSEGWGYMAGPFWGPVTSGEAGFGFDEIKRKRPARFVADSLGNLPCSVS
ncbi:hypothetical protein [Oribacterium sp. WCC10]|uniref:hypothetical protein n=1 Tax=Oribacterium sp. WCC10 TaxID=1855343 RepID=UPI0015876379|nr:hypothetical protein [Oribacterium sp. WCC10]